MMKNQPPKNYTIAFTIAAAFATLAGLEAQITPILPFDYGVTGIRQDSGGNVLITGGTGSPTLTGETPAFLYYGPLNSIPSATNGSGLYTYKPDFGSGQITGGAQFYGPNTNLYDPSIGAGNIRAVGAYKLRNDIYQNGMIYNGPLSGNGTWTSLRVPNPSPTNVVGDTIPHSTMGNLVVGNFDYESNVAAGNGFIYDINAQTYKTFSLGSYSTTFYGIWQDGGPNSTKYTIVGGLANKVNDIVEPGQGLVFNYDSSSDVNNGISNETLLSFGGIPTLDTHFEGISAVPGGFSLTCTTGQGAGYAFLPVNNDGSFGDPTWTAITNQINPSALTAGDTVIDYSVLGIYTTNDGAVSYISTVPEPSAWLFPGLGAVAIMLVSRRRAA